MAMSPSLKPHPWLLTQRMLQHGAALLPLLLVSLAMGMAIYHWAAGLGWADSFLNAAMLLGGMGPVGPELKHRAAKLFAGAYALYAGMLVLVAASILIAPIFHRFVHRFHLEAEERRRAQ